MTAYYADDWLTVYQGDCREVMASMEPESVHCVVTSPPYWGLRDYGTATWVGGDEGCVHKETVARHDAGRTKVDGFHGSAHPTSDKGAMNYREACRKCGAIRQDAQLGLEPTPEEYVANMVAVFSEVRRVLRSDGTVWLNLGDSYATNRMPQAGLKPKDLVGIPWRVAFALQADGWYLRSDIIWAKPNPMPESVTDRPTKAHEYLFLLSKSARYWYDAEAVAEPLTDSSVERLSQPSIEAQEGSRRVPGKTNGAMKAIGGPTWQERKAAGAGAGNIGVSETYQRGVHGEGLSHDLGGGATRNLRSVWTVSTQPYRGAHFAVFPEKLVEPCIKAGCPTLGTVLDPFAGSGTTGRVAQRLSRRAVLIDLNGDYLVQAMARNTDIPLGLESA